MSTLTDEPTLTLLQRLRGGDAAAREDLVARYLPRLTRWAHGRLPSGARDLSDTQDLVQVTLVRVLSHLEGFEHSGAGSLLGYLQQALLNVLRNEIRRSRRRGQHGELPEDLTADEEGSPLAQAAGRERVERYERALAQLNRREQELVVMRVELGLDNAQMAIELGGTADAVRMALRRATARLIEVLSSDASD